MTVRQIGFDDLGVGEKVTLKLRDGESVIVGKVSEVTSLGNKRVVLTNNRNSVVLTPSTNFRIFVDRGPTAAEVLDGLSVGAVFTYFNKYGITKKWVKTAPDRYTRVDADSGRPAVSYSKLGFPSEDASVVTIIRY